MQQGPFEDVLEIHSDQLNRYGGARGIRNEALLLSAIAQPHTTFEGEYLHKTMFDKAAAYLFHLCQNHPFLDGNKRVAAVSALVFLDMNHCSIDFAEMELENMVRLVAEGKAAKQTISAFFTNHA